MASRSALRQRLFFDRIEKNKQRFGCNWLKMTNNPNLIGWDIAPGNWDPEWKISNYIRTFTWYKPHWEENP